MNYQGWALEVERLGRLNALFLGHRIERVLSPSRAWQFTAVSPEGGVKVSVLTVVSLERKLQRQNHLTPWRTRYLRAGGAPETERAR